jgi:hypothetical protein
MRKVVRRYLADITNVRGEEQKPTTGPLRSFSDKAFTTRSRTRCRKSPGALWPWIRLLARKCTNSLACEENSVFLYEDMASSRANIVALSAKLKP